MLGEVISIGDELTIGQRLDTNSQWIAQRLNDLGVEVRYHSTVADDLAANVRVFREACDRADVVVSTGGLGPTADDLTRDAIAATAGVELELDEPSLEHIRNLFARRARPMPERNVVQAMFPRGSRPIHNPEGTAPGIDIAIARAERGPCRIFALPGVPVEMRQMWDGTVQGEILRMTGAVRVIRHLRIKCFGAGESQLEAMLPDIIQRGRDPSVGITVHEGTITLRITAAAMNEAECVARMAPTVDTIHQCLGTLAFGREEDELEHIVLRMLAVRGETLAVIEAATGGLVAERLASLDESRGVLAGAVVLGSVIPPGSRYDLPPAELARVVQAEFGANHAVVAGPLQETPGEPPSFPIVVRLGEKVIPLTGRYSGHSTIRRPLAAKQVLNAVRLAMLREG